MTHEIVCCAATTGEHQRRAGAHIFTSSVTSPGLAHLADLSFFSRISLLCVRWSANSAACIAEWRNRARSRRDLMELNDRDLWDMHLTRCDALYEASKPFWRE
jgi:uncharacterized protein YjiS (DUF1127 family)